MDYMVRATAADGYIRAFAVTSRKLTEEARTRHNSSPIATAAVGRLMAAGLMMGAGLKAEDDLLTLTMKGDGPMQGVTVTADSRGGVKGFAHNPQVMLPPNAQGKLDVGGAMGQGTLTVVRDQGKLGAYSSQTRIQSGEIGDDLSFYFATSEQVPTSIGLGVLMNKNNTVRQAGGFLIQLMPGYSEELVDRLEQKLLGTSSVTSLLDGGMTPEQMLGHFLEDMGLEITEKKEVSFSCSCSRDKVAKVLVSLGERELEDMIEEGKPAEVKCHFCNTSYAFSLDEMKLMLDHARS